MTDLDIELLMAYVDDELEAKRRTHVENLINQNQKAQQLVKKLKESAQYLKHHLDIVAEDDVPEHLIELLRPTSEKKVVPLNITKHQKISFNWPSLAAAATVLLMVGIVTGALILKNPDSPTLITANKDTLQQALETLPSGTQSDPKGGNPQIALISTYKTENGQVCREFKRETTHGIFSGLACRNQAGYWVNQIELADELLTPPKTNQDYTPASGSDDPISSMLDKLGAGSAIPIAEEQQLIEKKWH